MYGLYYLAINSFYVEIVKIRFRSNGYIKVIARYYSKGSDTLFHTEKILKISNGCFKYWEKYNFDRKRKMKINKLNYPKCPYCGTLINDMTKIPASLLLHQYGTEMVCPKKECGKKFGIDSRIEVSFETFKED